MREAQSGRALPLVLVVDDDPSMRMLLGESLRPAGFTIEEDVAGRKVLGPFVDAKVVVPVHSDVKPERDHEPDVHDAFAVDRGPTAASHDRQ